MTRQMVNAIIDMGEYNRFSKGIFGWVGFNTKWIEYENVERGAGKMVFLEIIFIFPRRYNGIFHNTACPFINTWFFTVYHCFYTCICNNYQNAYMGRSGCRLSVFGVYHMLSFGRANVLSGYFRAISVQNIPRNKKATDLYSKRK